MITLPPFKAFLASNIPSVYDNTLSYYDELTKLIAYLEQEVVPAVNETSAGLATLKDFVENYFKNLDVQDEINNKLDEMAESGQLAEIVAAYLAVKGVLAFDTPTALKAGTNLIEGSYAKTYGYKRKDDGVYDLYTVRATDAGDVDDGYNTIILTADPTLVAIRLQQGGKRVINLVAGDNLQDYLSLEGEKEIVLPASTTIVETDALLLNSDTTLDLNGSTVNFSYARSSIFTYDWDETLGFMGYAPNDTFTGYGGYKNITIKNGSITGGTSCFMHSENVKFENVYFQTAGSRHSLQFAACKGVEIINCEFEGGRDDSVDNASELINLDFCAYSAQPYINEYSTMFDGTSNKCVLVEGNTFKQNTNENMGYFGAVGSHGNSTNTAIIVDGFVARDNNFGLPREFAIGLKNYKNVVIENNILEDALGTYKGRFILKVGSVDGAQIVDNTAKGTRAFFTSSNPTYAGNKINISNNVIIADDPAFDTTAVFVLHNIHDSQVCGNMVQYTHHPIHINTRAYFDQIEDDPAEHTINLLVQNNTFEKLTNTDTYLGCRISTCDAVKFVDNNFIHDGTVQANWRILYFQNTQTNLVVQGNTTDFQYRFAEADKVNTKFNGNNAIYPQSSSISSTSTSGTFTGVITNFSKIILLVGEAANTQTIEILPFLTNGVKFGTTGTFIKPVAKNDGTYGKLTFTISNDGEDWAYTGDIPLRQVFAQD